MHRKMLMINGKQFQSGSDSSYEPEFLQSSSTAGTVNMLEESNMLPPQNTNPSSKGVPLLWSNITDGQFQGTGPA